MILSVENPNSIAGQFFPMSLLSNPITSQGIYNILLNKAGQQVLHQFQKIWH